MASSGWVQDAEGSHGGCLGRKVAMQTVWGRGWVWGGCGEEESKILTRRTRKGVSLNVALRPEIDHHSITLCVSEHGISQSGS